MRKNNMRKYILGAAVLAATFATSVALASNPGTFSTTTAGSSGTVSANNGQCFVVASWWLPFGFTQMTVTNNGHNQFSANGMHYTGGVQVRCGSTWKTTGFARPTQTATSPACSGGTTPNSWLGYLWSWQDNGCVL